ncbi:MAG: cellulase family glycosylhydrolase [Ignavibacteriae bacterium]|nr:cellulase family glycosylhydrolase [Ignavibacteriota bacterium]
MKRREFVKTSAVLGFAAFSGIPFESKSQTKEENMKFSKYKGFNLTQKTGGSGPRRKFEEEDFEIMAELGFNFARIPMSYWNWSKPENWLEINEDIFTDIDEVIEFGKQYKIHINLNLHRVPGYCINGRNLEPMDLFDDTIENMQTALDAVVHHWKFIANRYKGLPNQQVTFDLINEPPGKTNVKRYEEIVRALVKGIKEEDSDRLIVVDGKDIGRYPLLGIEDLNIVQSTRGYDPMSVSHYTATWVPKHEFETFNKPSWPLPADDGKIWNKNALREKLINSWKPVVDKGVQVHVGEWGCFNQTPHDICLKWMEDILLLWKEANWGQSMWNLKGDFGIINSNRSDVKYEEYKGHKLDRKMLELLKQF